MSDRGFALLFIMVGVVLTLAVEYGLLVARALWLWAKWKRELEEDDPL